MLTHILDLLFAWRGRFLAPVPVPVPVQVRR